MKLVPPPPHELFRRAMERRDSSAGSLPEECVYEREWETDYHTKTVVRSCRDGVRAFKKYTEWFSFAKAWAEKHESVALLPCGAQKPIGSSQLARKKYEALVDAGVTDFADVYIVSEPCTVIPYELRKTLPPCNYDYPPEYAKEKNCPEAFEIFTERLAEWIDQSYYQTFYPYLIKHHHKIFQRALEKCDTDPEVNPISTSTYTKSAGRRVSDMMVSKDKIAEKIKREIGIEV